MTSDIKFPLISISTVLDQLKKLTLHMYNHRCLYSYKKHHLLQMKNKLLIKGLILLLSFLPFISFTQTAYNSAAAYGLRKVIPTYTGSALQVRRTCDNAVRDIGFTCGELDTNTLKTFVVAANPLSSISTTAAAAFSLRRLSCSYAGSAIQVRRSSDNTTSNIGFTSWGDLDTVALKAFVGTGSGFVTIWYDQSGNGRNASQATAGNQPRIVNAGVVERQNNMPAVRWLGINYGLSTAAFTAFGTAACFNSVAKVNSNLAYNCTVNKCTANFPAPLDLYNGTVVIGNGPSYTFFSFTPTFNSTQALCIITYQGASGGTYNGYFNGASAGSGSISFFGDSGTPLILGSRPDLLTGLNGWISEVITWAALPTSTERNFVEWTQAAYYGISGPLLTPIPVGAPSGFIAKLYDQSGNGNHALQGTNGNQPRIINVGVIEKSGTRSAIKFNGSPQTLTVTTPVSSYPVSISCLANTGGVTTYGAFVKLGGVTAGSAGIGLGVGATGTDFDNTGFSVIGLKEITVWCPSNPGVNYPSTPFAVTQVQQTAGAGSGMNIYMNGTNIPLSNSATATSGTSIAGLLSIGGYTNTFVRYPVVKESEVIVFGSALNTTHRTLLETNQASHYNITISNSKYTPPSATSYNLFVNGVGRESTTDSVAATRSSAGMGFTVGTTATDFLKDNGDYITAGVSCLSPGSTTLNVPATVVARWINDWYVNKIDVGSNSGNLSFYFNFSDYGVSVSPGAAANYVLLYRNTTAANFTIVPGTTTSVVGNKVFFQVSATNITDKYYYTIGTKDGATSPLPVVLTDFTAEKKGAMVKTEWHTIYEANSDYFVVQRSQDAVNFTDIATVKASGNSIAKKGYSSMDEKPFNGVSYYRLKLVDTDKQFRYSQIETIEFGSGDEPVIYPNPTNGRITVDNGDGYNKIIVMDALGKLVYTGKLEGSSQTFVLDHLSNGEYFVTLISTSGQNKFTSKVVIDKLK